MEEDGKLLLADQLGQTSGGRDVAGGQGCERRGVEALDLAHSGNELTVLVYQKDHLGVGIAEQLVDDGVYLFELLIVHDHLRARHV